MANELYRTYEVLVEESVHTDHPKRATDKTKKPSVFNAEIDGTLRDTHMIFQDAVCYNTLCFAGLAGLEIHQSGEREGDKAKLTLAARRLKRDKLVNKDGSSVDALWCPPLILEGEPNPTAATKPKAGKEKKKESDPAEVSFSLIASPLPGDYWNEVAGVPSSNDKSPVHLTVSFKIEGDETAKLRAETKQWLKGSHRGFAKKGEKDADKRRYFNWPIDKETSKFEAEKPDEKPKQLWCGDGKHVSTWLGFALRRDKIATGEEGAVYFEKDFQILSIDLGNRFAAAFARLRIHADQNGEGRVISADGFSPVIKSDMVRQGTLRLQGENAKIWQHVRGDGGVCKKDAGGNYLYALEDEEYGNQGRGRFPTNDEYTIFSILASRLVPAESLSLSGKEKETYPELGDHLGFRLKRKIGRLSPRCLPQARGARMHETDRSN